jgi:hypothetical protein
MAASDVLIVMEMDWLPDLEWKVLLALAHFKNHKTALCCPSYEEIARLAHTSRNSVARAIPKLKERSLLSWTSGNQHYSNRYGLHLQQYRAGAAGNTTDSQQYVEGTTGEAVATVQQYPSGTGEILEPVNLQAKAQEEKEVRRDEEEPYSTVPLPEKAEDTELAEQTQTPNADEISAEDAFHLGTLFDLVSPQQDEDDGRAFLSPGSGIPPVKMANCLWWAFKKSNWWSKHLTPTPGDFLRALPRIQEQYDKFIPARSETEILEKWPTVRDVVMRVCEHEWVSVLHTTDRCWHCGLCRTNPAVTEWTDADDRAAEYMELVECYDPYDPHWWEPEPAWLEWQRG